MTRRRDAGVPGGLERARLWVPLGHAGVEADLAPAVARQVAIARACGASVEPALAVAAEIAAEQATTAAELDRVVRPAVAVARGLVALPVALVPVLSLVLHLDVVAFAVGEPLGGVVAAVVVALVGAAALWMRLLVASALRAGRHRDDRERPRWSLVVAALGVAWMAAGPVAGAAAGILVAVAWRPRGHRGAPPGLDEAADLAATAVGSGVALGAALRLAARHLDEPVLARRVAGLALRLDLRPPAPGVPTPVVATPDGWAALEALCLDLAASGRPAGPPLRRMARRLRASRAAAVRLAVARLPARLTFPTALLLVPATVLAIGAPIVVRGLGAVTGT